MKRSEDVAEFHESQIVTAWWLGQSTSKAADLVGCWSSAAVDLFPKCPKNEKAVN